MLFFKTKAGASYKAPMHVSFALKQSASLKLLLPSPFSTKCKAHHALIMSSLLYSFYGIKIQFLNFTIYHY